MRRRTRRVTLGKEAIKHSHTRVDVIGNGSAVTTLGLIQTGAGDRSTDGTESTIQNSANTGKILLVSDIVKYINIIIQAATTQAGKTSSTMGWVEWAVVWRNEELVTIPSTNIGTKTLGDIASQMFRGDCIMTGQFPVAEFLPNQTVIPLKLPKKAVKWKIGNQLVLYFLFRDSDVTNLETDTIKVISSAHFKVYS